MKHHPGITFHVAGYPEPVVPESRLWRMALSGKTGHEEVTSQWTVGDYLETAGAFLTRDRGGMVCHAVAQLSGSPASVRTMAVSLEKHGAFYHPLKVTVTTETGTIPLVLNGAVKDPGLSLVKTEHGLLARLAGQGEPGCIPRVFGTGTIACEKGEAGFFLGEWFEGFHEFHVSRTDQGDQVAVWKEAGTREPIPWDRADIIYETIACVLTAFYDIDTGQEIFPWHHAAGDFVTNDRGEVRLITVRGLGLLADLPPETPDPEVRRLFGLLFFFLNLTLCMRLDRLDGTGPLVWLPDRVVDATVSGVCRSLADREDRAGPMPWTGGPPGLSDRFLEFARRFDPDQLHGIMTHFLEDRHFSAAEARLIEARLKAHCERIRHVLVR